MWGIYWRCLMASVLAIILVSFMHHQFDVLTLIGKTEYYPSFFWFLIAVSYCVFSLFQRKGLIYSLWGYRLHSSNSNWRNINATTILFFMTLVLVAHFVRSTADAEVWSWYKLYMQPLTLLIWPALLAKYMVPDDGK